MARMIPLHIRHLLALLLLASAGATYAEPAVEVQHLANHIWLDDSSETELVISNISEDDTLPEGNMATRQPAFKKLRWQTGNIPYQAEVQAVAQSMQVDPALIHAVIATESGYNPQAQSRKGAYGLMQVLPATAKSLSAIPVRQWSVRQQILWGSRYLKNMLELFEGDVTLALAAYNAGPNAVKMRQNTMPPFAETRQYVPKVLSYYRAFKIRLPHETTSAE
ncbi:MAG: lytic transglycosylase domain-containing protein [Methylophilus sp.]|uniref:lytic transglycosylase domain-containing protein n=1 Tax=Methylophilus sp. TaxID=29541 RepID=UPI003FA097B6